MYHALVQVHAMWRLNVAPLRAIERVNWEVQCTDFTYLVVALGSKTKSRLTKEPSFGWCWCL